MKSITKFLALSALLAATTAGFAASPAAFGPGVQGFYAGADAGYGSYTCSNCATTGTGGYYPVPSSYTTSSTSNSGFAGTLFGGYQVNQYLAIELGWGKLPSSKSSFTNPQDPTQNINLTFDINHYYAAVKAMLPLKNQFGLFGKVGYDTLYTSSNSSNSTTGGLIAAAGASYNLNSELALTAAYNQILANSSSNSSIGYATLGLTYLL